MPATFEVMAEVDAAGFFEDESVNWSWCVENATFVHKDACEFIVHAGTGSGECSMVEQVVTSMREFGCTADFIAAYQCYRARCLKGSSADLIQVVAG